MDFDLGVSWMNRMDGYSLYIICGWKEGRKGFLDTFFTGREKERMDGWVDIISR